LGGIAVSPVETGVQIILTFVKYLSSGFGRNDGKPYFSPPCEIINFDFRGCLGGGAPGGIRAWSPPAKGQVARKGRGKAIFP